MGDLSRDEVSTMIKTCIVEHCQTCSHDAGHEMPCEPHKYASRWILWAFTGLATVIATVMVIFNTWNSSLSANQREVSSSLRQIELRQAKADSDMEYIKGALADMRMRAAK